MSGGASHVPLGRSESAGLRNPLCVALDFTDPAECAEMAARIGPVAGLLKVGLQAFAAGGPDVVSAVANEAPVFLDLKLHDIPAQVGGAVKAVAELDVSFTTVHAAGGTAMLRAALAEAPQDLVVLAVTVLTSLDREDLRAAGMRGEARDRVLRLADVALSAGVRGLVCSPLEAEAVRERFGPRRDGGPLLVVPGIRGSVGDMGDQKRTLAPRDAMAAGADIIVVGRPITQAADPRAAATTVLGEIE